MNYFIFKRHALEVAKNAKTETKQKQTLLYKKGEEKQSVRLQQGKEKKKKKKVTYR